MLRTSNDVKSLWCRPPPGVHPVELLVGGIAGHFAADPGRQHKCGRLRRKLDLGQDDAGQNPPVDVDLPRMAAMWHEVPGLSQPGLKTMMGHHFLGIGQGYFILEFGIRQACHLRLHGQDRALIANPHAHFSAAGDCDKSVRDLLSADDLAAPTVIATQDLSFDPASHAPPAVRDSRLPRWCNAWARNGMLTWSHLGPP